jgi:hypothetical protein
MDKPKKKSARTSQSKGGRRSWAEPDQDAWLKEHLPDYVASQGKGPKALVEFWPPLWEEWFKRWPEVTPVLAGPSAAGEDDTALGDDTLKAAVTKKKVVSKQAFQMRATGTYFEIY